MARSLVGAAILHQRREFIADTLEAALDGFEGVGCTARGADALREMQNAGAALA